MEEEQIEKAVLAYLKKKGYKAAELAFQDDQQSHRSASSASSGPSMEPVVLNQILFYSRSDNDPGQYSDGYKKLRSWVHSSLDLYKNELLRILYPVFVHSYMDLVSKGFAQEARTFFQSYREDHEAMHLHDLQKLEGLISPEHLKENDIAKTLRENKVNIKLCQYSFELLLQYLHSTDSMLMLGIVNAHINLKVFPGQPSVLPEEEDSPTLPGKMQEALDSINQKEIYWGVLEDSIEDRFEKEQTADADKAALEAKEIEGEDGKKRASDGKQGLMNKKLKKDKATSKDLKLEQSRSKVPPVKPELTLPIMSEESERRILEDLRNRVRLGSNALPSVCFYTFVNTHNSLSCSSMSADGAQLVGGFSDSSLKVWNMEKLGERDISSENGINIGNKDNGSAYVHLTGHSGPVYAAQFSPDSDFLLSASADCTVRLWSLKLKTNLVCYKGHNYPVWDVQFSPVGHYFVSASHDRTARIWSMDRVQPLRILAGHLSDVDCVQWHVNCNYIATGSSDKTVRLWDVQTGECMRVFAGHRGMVVSLAMSPDGRYMASGDEDGAIMMWDLATTKCVSPLLGHTGSVWSLAFSGEGSLLASGSADNTLRLWDVNASSKASRTADKSGTGRRLRLLKTLPTKSTPVHALRFSRRNLLFAAGPFSSPKLQDKI